MINAHKLFLAFDDEDKELMYRLGKQWWESKLVADEITLTVAESDMLHHSNKLIQTVKMIRERTKCSLRTAKTVCDRERAKAIHLRYNQKPVGG